MRFSSVFFITLLLCKIASAEESLDSLLAHNIKVDNEAVLIITGETHNSPNKDILRFSLIETLYKQVGLNIIIEEFSPSYIYYLNKYIKAENDTLLSFLFKYGYNSNRESTFKQYKELYLKLSSPEDFYILGVDIEGITWIPFFALNDLRPKRETPTNIENTFLELEKVINEGKLPNKKMALTLANSFKDSIAKYNEVYKSYLGDNYFLFNRIVEGLVIGIEYPMTKRGQKNMDFREELIYRNIIQIINEYPEHKLFGQFGLAHIPKVAQSKWIWLQEWESFVAKLNSREESGVKSKICAIAYYERLFPDPKDEFYNYGLLTPELRKEIYNKTTSSFGVYKMCETGSPFESYCNLIDYIIVDKATPNTQP